MKNMLLTALVATVALGTVGVGFTLAQDAALTDTVAVEEQVVENEGCPFGYEMGPRKGYEEMIEKKAEILNLSVDDLKSKLDKGKNFEEIAVEQGVTYTDLHEVMEVRFEERLQEKIDSGFITEEQAQQFREQHEENEGEMRFMGMGKGFGGGMHKGGMHL